MQNYEDMDIVQLWITADQTKDGKTLREIHRALKRKGDVGLSFLTRYPNFPLIVSITSLMLVLLEPILYDILLRMQIWQGM